MAGALTGYDFWRSLGSPRYVSSPMVDASESAFRSLVRRYGTDLCFTPMLHAKTFIKDATYRRQRFDVVEQYESGPVVVQFAGDSPKTLLAAGEMVQHNPHVVAIDLNCGCPQPIARKGHYGAFLLREPEVICEVVRTLSNSLIVPVTVKIRLLDEGSPDSALRGLQGTLRLVEQIQDAGASVITVHGRTRIMTGNKRTGAADMSAIAAVKRHLSIPVIANGSVETFEDVEHVLFTTGADAVMSAEAQLEYPPLFSRQAWGGGGECRDRGDAVTHGCDGAGVEATNVNSGNRSLKTGVQPVALPEATAAAASTAAAPAPQSVQVTSAALRVPPAVTSPTTIGPDPTLTCHARSQRHQRRVSPFLLAREYLELVAAGPTPYCFNKCTKAHVLRMLHAPLKLASRCRSVCLRMQHAVLQQAAAAHTGAVPPAAAERGQELTTSKRQRTAVQAGQPGSGKQQQEDQLPPPPPPGELCLSLHRMFAQCSDERALRRCVDALELSSASYADVAASLASQLMEAAAVGEAGEGGVMPSSGKVEVVLGPSLEQAHAAVKARSEAGAAAAVEGPRAGGAAVGGEEEGAEAMPSPRCEELCSQLRAAVPSLLSGTAEVTGAGAGAGRIGDFNTLLRSLGQELLRACEPQENDTWYRRHPRRQKQRHGERARAGAVGASSATAAVGGTSLKQEETSQATGNTQGQPDPGASNNPESAPAVAASNREDREERARRKAMRQVWIDGGLRFGR